MIFARTISLSSHCIIIRNQFLSIILICNKFLLYNVSNIVHLYSVGLLPNWFVKKDSCKMFSNY